MLMAMSDKPHALHSAAVVYEDRRPVWRHVATARMRMRPLSPGYIDGYVDAELGGDPPLGRRPTRSKPRGSGLFSAIGSDYHAILGLPLLPLLDWLHLRGTSAGMSIPLAGVIGAPIAHSRSPALHGYWLRSLGIPRLLHPDGGRPGRSRAGAPRDAQDGLRRPQRHHPAQGKGARHRRCGDRPRGADRRREHADLPQGRQDPRRQHRRLRLHREPAPQRAGLASAGRPGRGLRRRRRRAGGHRRR